MGEKHVLELDLPSIHDMPARLPRNNKNGNRARDTDQVDTDASESSDTETEQHSSSPEEQKQAQRATAITIPDAQIAPTEIEQFKAVPKEQQPTNRTTASTQPGTRLAPMGSVTELEILSGSPPAPAPAHRKLTPSTDFSDRTKKRKQDELSTPNPAPRPQGILQGPSVPNMPPRMMANPFQPPGMVPWSPAPMAHPVGFA